MNFKFDHTNPQVAARVRLCLSDVTPEVVGYNYSSGNLTGFSISDDAQAQRFYASAEGIGLTDCRLGDKEPLPENWMDTNLRFGSGIFIGPMPEKDLPATEAARNWQPNLTEAHAPN